MPRATLIVDVDRREDVAAMDAWFARWQARLAHPSDNLGCGCCVDIWQIEAPQEAIDELPPALFAGPDRTLG